MSWTINWSVTKQRLHPQSVAEISQHSVCQGRGFDNVEHRLGLATRTQISVCKSPFSSEEAVSGAYPVLLNSFWMLCWWPVSRMWEATGNGWLLYEGWCTLLRRWLSSPVCQSVSRLWWTGGGQCCLGARWYLPPALLPLFKVWVSYWQVLPLRTKLHLYVCCRCP